jgi:hypothetical protein
MIHHFLSIVLKREVQSFYADHLSYLKSFHHLHHNQSNWAKKKKKSAKRVRIADWIYFSEG